MKDKLTFCLVGRGSIGSRHLKNLKSLSTNNIIAYSEFIDKDKDKEYKDKYGIRTFHNLEEVKKVRPSAFIIANPTANHMKFADIAVGMNSHIFMEKPISHNLDGIENLRNELSKRKLVFLMANNFRFHPVLNEIKRLIERKEFGDIYFARIMAGQYLPDWHPSEDYSKGYAAREDLGGGVVLTLQHEIDYAYWLFGKFKRIKSFVKKISKLEIDVDDVASVIIETESGQLIEIHIDYLQRPPKRTIQIQGEKGSIDFCFGDQCLKFYDIEKKKYINILDLTSCNDNQMYIDEMEHFIKCIAAGEKPKSTLEDAVYILETCVEIKKGLIP